MFSYTELRKRYPEFIYRGYEIEGNPRACLLSPHLGVPEEAGRAEVL